MKPVVLTMAAMVLVFIGLANQRQDFRTVSCNTVYLPAQTQTMTESDREETSQQKSEAPSALVNFSGKNMNFFLVAF
ncbi:MAG TPA: hypothetical protein VHI78_10520 [Bacteroidales bacterium]|nr:hypothetical protein [Bacteroidales bacterium]